MLDWELANVKWSGSYAYASWVFLRWLGVIYFIAFVSLGVQIHGLVGSRGILPASDFLAMRPEAQRGRRWMLYPTLCWLHSSDRFLLFLAWGGAVLALLLVAGIAPLPILIGLWVFYLSLFTVCRIFLGYQWDILLLEAGFLAIFLAPVEWVSWGPATSPSPVVRWLFDWLLFRLMFSSGAVKVRSGDLTWRRFTALTCYYETQPLPNPGSWWMHQLPIWFQKFSVLVMFVVELSAPFFIFGPLPFRCFAGIAFIILMILIMATGNYGFFNLLTIGLALMLFDDALCREILRWITGPRGIDAGVMAIRSGVGWVDLPLAALIVLLSADKVARLFRRQISWSRPVERFLGLLEPFRIVNSYGLFAVMTTSRPEIIVEGSNDGNHWQEYEFKWKPGDVRRIPGQAAPHQPRLDWQMWFAALGYFQNNLWFEKFLVRLLQGSAPVLALVKSNPFPDRPPRFIRAVLYDYRFTDRATRRATGTFWQRQRTGLYSPVCSLPKGVGQSG